MSSKALRFDHETVRVPDTDRLSDSTLLAVLSEETCTDILTALESGPQTVAELHDELGVPVSTLYRKVDALVDAGLLAEQTRFQSDGNHKSEYVRSVSELSLDVSLADARVTVEFVDRSDE